MIGRKKEQKELKALCERDEAQFVVVYGRRRVGKTYLVRNVFSNQFTFQYTGAANVGNKEQLAEFHRALLAQGLPDAKKPSNWFDAFAELARLISTSSDEKKLIFIDEMPWMDAPNSRFVPALEHFWNAFGSAQADVVLIVCASATSWIVKKIFRNRGGLHNRVTRQIYLKPFTLRECADYAASNKLMMTHDQIMETYMIMGGVPYYWSLLDGSMSVAQNVDALIFSDQGQLHHEFEAMCESMFNSPETYMRVIRALGEKKTGMVRSEIISQAKMADNGVLTTILDDLESCGFIRKYSSIALKTKDATYQLIDNFTLFYFRFLQEPEVSDPNRWSKMQNTPACNTWRGLAFERVCLLHEEQIKAALGISGILSGSYSWYWKGDEQYPRCQIDLLIDRADGVINLCEIKYSRDLFVADKNLVDEVQRKATIFAGRTKTRKALHPVLITARTLLRNAYSDTFTNIVTGESLFA